VDNHTLAGAVMLVASRDQVVSLDAVGYMDIAAQRPMRTDALFWIASQSKPMTATALMMLVDEGKINVDDPVEKYLPEFKGQWLKAEQDTEHILLRRPAHPITIKNVLSHTSGVPFSSPLEQPTLDVLPLAARVRSYAMLALEFEPDSKYAYSNAGINTAGRIIEVVSGMPYEQFMEQRLFQPLGMKDTTFWPSAKQVRRLATSYKPNAAKNGLEETTITQLRYPLTDRTRQPMPAGGLFSTAPDVARFCQMILNGGALDGKRYLSEAAVKQMTSRQTPGSLADDYGFGWKIGEGEFGHGGAYATNMTIDTRHGLILIWMVQHAGFPGDGAKSKDAYMQAARAAFAK
jgi:CubicO group peptidase (beta-lactamase class C family)